MDPLCLSAARLVLLSILVASTQGRDTRAPYYRPMFCLEPPFQGPGEARIPRFFFSTKSGVCESFMFGGGGAKLNNFLSKEECTRVCSGRWPTLQAKYKRDLEAQLEPEDEVEDEIEDEIEDTLEYKIEDRDTDENPEDVDEVEDETEIEIEYLRSDKGVDEDFEDNDKDVKEEDNLYEDEFHVEIEYGTVY